MRVVVWYFLETLIILQDQQYINKAQLKPYIDTRYPDLIKWEMWCELFVLWYKVKDKI